jgi:hypothetical protein
VLGVLLLLLMVLVLGMLLLLLLMVLVAASASPSDGGGAWAMLWTLYASPVWPSLKEEEEEGFRPLSRPRPLPRFWGHP